MKKINMKSFSFNLSLPCVRETGDTYLRTPEEVVTFFSEMANMAQECFQIVTLNVKNKVIDKHLISLGLVDAALVHPREVFRAAILDGAAAFILVHNHPSGEPNPSAEDLKITRQLVEVGRIVDIRILDHVVIGRGATPFCSMRASGVINFS